MKNIIVLIFGILLSINSCFAVTSDNWQNYVNHKIKNEKDYKAKQDKKNVYLYYEIYDAFCRKYGYKYSDGEYTTKKPAKAEVVQKNIDISYQNDYKKFYEKYSDYITHKMTPTPEYIQAKRKLDQAHIEIKLTPEKFEKHYYMYLDVKASQATQDKEVNQVYIAKKSKINPQPYSVVGTVAKYKILKKEDVKMILEHLQARLNTTVIDITDNSFATSMGDKVMTDEEVKDIYFIYEYQPEKFRSYAPELDKKYSQYYLKP